MSTKAKYIQKIQELMSLLESDTEDLKNCVESSIYTAQEAMEYISALHKEHGAKLEPSVKQHLNSLYTTILDGHDVLCDIHELTADNPSRPFSRLTHNKKDNK